MHPAIASYISEENYSGALQSHSSLQTKCRLKVPLEKLHENFPMSFWDVESPETLGGVDSLSTTNTRQVSVLNVI